MVMTANTTPVQLLKSNVCGGEAALRRLQPVLSFVKVKVLDPVIITYLTG